MPEDVKLVMQLAGGNSYGEGICDVRVYSTAATYGNLNPAQEEFIANCMDMIVKTMLGLPILDPKQPRN